MKPTLDGVRVLSDHHDGKTVAMPTETPPHTTSTKTDHAGETLGDFRLIRRLGEGGMGQVYLAEQQSLQRRVAIKLLRSDVAQDEVFLKRFEGEAKAIAQLTHQNIVQVYSVGNVNGLRYMALEYVEGTNLKDYLIRKGPPELNIALVIMKQIASALLKAAELGIIHRDIKPENILLTRKVEVKVADFGLSRMAGDDLNLTQTGTTMGTPLYMSPEQVMGKPVDPRTDLYSFGATCYHLLAGHPPFTAETAMAVGVKHISDPPQPLKEIRPDIPDALANLVHRLLAKKPEDRPQSAREVLREIRKIQDALAGGTTPMRVEDDHDDEPLDFGATLTKSSPAVMSSKLEQPAKRSWLLPIVGGSVMLAIIGGAVFGMMLRGDEQAKGTTASIVASSTATTPRNNASKLFQQEREKALLKNVEETQYQRDPEKPFDLNANADKFPLGIRARAELLNFYMDKLGDEEMLKKARKFSGDEANAAVAPDAYKSIGLIGQALLLAVEGNARESYETLEKAVALKASGNIKRFIFNNYLRSSDLVEVMLFTFQLNEKTVPIPATLKPVKEELEKASKSGPPDRLRNKK
jgi:serine/threonine protein kinase